MSTKNITEAPNDVLEDKRSDHYQEVDYDELLSAAGEMGRYQYFLFFATFPFFINGAFIYFGQLFMTEVSANHWCWVPELANLTDIERRNLAIPPDHGSRFGYSRCTVYKANWSEVLASGINSKQTWSTVPCQHGWEYNRSDIPYPTISSEMNWVCDKDNYQATAQSIFFFGAVIGGFIFGWVADRYGRLPAAVISNIIGCIGGVISIFARNFHEFALYRFFTGLAYDNCTLMAYLLILEYIAPKYRTVISNLSYALFYSLGVVSLPWIALACGHWKIICLVTTLPLGLAILAPLIVPESPRWLLSRGRVEETIKKILTIGRINKKEIPPKLIEHFKLSLTKKKEQENMSLIVLLKRPLLRRMLICVCLQFVCCTIVFDGLVRSIGQLDFDFFISFSAISFTEFPSIVLVAFIMDKMGRRLMCVTVFSLSCIFSIVTVLIGVGLPSVLCAVIARFMINMAYNATMQWAPEMMPVSVRGTASALVHVCGCIATVLAPYIVYLETYIHWLPLVIVGCVAGAGAILTIALPETANKEMPQTFEDAEELVREQKVWDFGVCKKKTSDQSYVNDSFSI